MPSSRTLVVTWGVEVPRLDLTPYHAKCYAFERAKPCAMDSMKKLAGELVEAQIDRNPQTTRGNVAREEAT